MSTESKRSSSRRAVLTAGVGGIAGLVLDALGRAAPVRAADGDPLVVGSTVQGTQYTRLERVGSSVDGTPALWVLDLTGKANGGGVVAYASAGPGLVAKTNNGAAGVIGASNETVGVDGGGKTVGVRGSNLAAGTGAMGYSGPYPVPGHRPKTGVYGIATDDASSVGVYGTSVAGVGIKAEAGPDGTALEAAGAVRFSTAGLATVAAGASNVVVAADVPLTASAKILVTLMANPNLGKKKAPLSHVEVDAAAGTFRIVLSGTAPRDIPVAFFILS